MKQDYSPLYVRQEVHEHVLRKVLIFSVRTKPVYIDKYEPVREKTNNLGSDQIRHKPGCTGTEDG